MAILPINSVSARNSASNSVNFGSKKRNGQENYVQNPAKSDKMAAAAVPVVVLMAMSPSMLNAKEPLKVLPMDKELNVSELMAATDNKAEKSTYVAGLDEFQQVPAWKDWGYLKNHKIQQHIQYANKGVASDLTRHILFVANEDDDNNTLRHVFVLREDEPGSKNEFIIPSSLLSIVSHAGRYFTLKVMTPLFDKNDRQTGFIINEVDAPNDIINGILDWTNSPKNYSDVKYERTESLKKMDIKIVDY